MQYDKPLSTDPNALLREANRRFEAGHLSEAALLYQQLHANFPPQSFVLNPLAQIAMTSGHVAEAIELMRQSLLLSAPMGCAGWRARSEWSNRRPPPR